MPFSFGKGKAINFTHKDIECGVMALQKDGFWIGTAATYISGEGITLFVNDGESEEKAIEAAKQDAINHIDKAKK